MASPLISATYRGYVGIIVLLFVGLMSFLFAPLNNNLLYIILTKLKANKLLFYLLLWFIGGVSFSFFRGSNDLGYILSVLILPFVFIFGIITTSYHSSRNMVSFFYLVFIVLNILLTGGAIGSEISARYITQATDNLLIGGSGFWAQIGIFFPVFLNYSLKRRNFLFKCLTLSLILFLVYKLFYSGYATPLGLLLLNLVLIGTLKLLSARFNNLSSFLVNIIAFSVLILVTYYIYSSIISSNSLGIREVQYRFLNFEENPLGGGYTGKEGGISRIELNEFSLNTFINHPLFGGGGNMQTSIYEGVAGGHSSFFDLLAVLGLFGGGGAFIVFMIIIIKRSISLYLKSKNLLTITNLATVITFVIGGIINPFWSGPLLISFLLLISFDRINELKNN